MDYTNTLIIILALAIITREGKTLYRCYYSNMITNVTIISLVDIGSCDIKGPGTVKENNRNDTTTTRQIRCNTYKTQ